MAVLAITPAMRIFFHSRSLPCTTSLTVVEDDFKLVSDRVVFNASHCFTLVLEADESAGQLFGTGGQVVWYISPESWRPCGDQLTATEHKFPKQT